VLCRRVQKHAVGHINHVYFIKSMQQLKMRRYKQAIGKNKVE